MRLKTILSILLIVAIAASLTTAKTTRKKKRKSHKDLIEESAKIGQERLEDFKKKNPKKETTEKSFEILRQKKNESAVIEEAAILSLEATKNLIASTGRCLSELQGDHEFLELWTSLIDCPEPNITCDDSYFYRSANGSCNNLQFPDWGMAFTAQQRYVPAAYDDGVDMPRDYDLPSPRLVSNMMFNNTDGPVFDRRRTAELMAWGQLIAHDFVLTPTIDGMLKCCEDENIDNPACFPIEVPVDDEYFHTECMNFVRSSPATEGCVPTHREQINEITSYIDGSMLYGSTEKQLNDLREHQGGRMRCTDSDLLPENKNGTCIKSSHGDYCQAAGDERVDVVPNLGGNHILLMREHNRIADTLAEVNPHWDDERIFQETRKIVAAEIQHITYEEYLPPILGPDAMQMYELEVTNKGYDDQYNPMINPEVRNAFAAAAFRFGHSQVMPEQAYLLNDFITFQHKSLEGQFMNTHMIQKQDGKKLPDLMRWLSFDRSMGTDRFFEKEVRDLLFLKNGTSTDLVARNIQRGRDHGLGSYAAYREHCGLSPVTSWNPNQPEGLVDHRWRDTRILKDLYQSIEEIDLYVGGMTEKNVRGGLVGPTFACLMGEQFSDFKKGDRFWYERPDSRIAFTEAQLNSIKRVKLSKLFCENFGLDRIQRRVFTVVSESNDLVPCADLPDINFRLWRD